MVKRRSAAFQITLTEGALRVGSGERILTILPAPSPSDAEEPADFSVDLDAILYWDPPHESIEITVEELQRIVQAIEEEFDRLGLVVAFE